MFKRKIYYKFPIELMLGQLRIDIIIDKNAREIIIYKN